MASLLSKEGARKLLIEGLPGWNTGGLTYVQLHTGNPGAAGTANVAAESKRVGSNWEVFERLGKNSAQEEWSGVAATETYRFFSLWTQAVGGLFLGYGEFTEPIEVNKGDTFKVPKNQLEVEAKES